MKKNFQNIKSWYSAKKMKLAIYSVAVISITLTFLSMAAGPAKSGEAVTGAPFNNGKTCTKCHSGGNFGGTIKTQLFDSITNTAVTAYSPGKKYYLKITMAKTSTTIPKYGFQTTAATLANVNVNKWGPAPAKTHNKLLKGHNYLEQSVKLTSGTIKLPFTGPAIGTGSIVFYTAGNLVNGTGNESGDQPVKTSLTITEGPAPQVIAANQNQQNVIAVKYSISLYAHGGITYLNFNNGRDKEQKVQIILSDMQGKPFYSNRSLANPGDNVWPLQTVNKKGIIIATVITEDGVRTSQKIVLAD